MEKYDFSLEEIAEATIKCCNELSPLIQPRKLTQNMVYWILKQFFIEKKRFVIANCPTGSGKTIIGILLYFAVNYMISKRNNPDKKVKSVRDVFDVNQKPIAYYLTSNKLLQEQIDNDIRRFEIDEYLSLLKGSDNYECIKATEKFNRDAAYRTKMANKSSDNKTLSYTYRPCKGYSGERLYKKFRDCFDKCPYKNARFIASNMSCAVLNYAYFLNVLRGENDDFSLFKTRLLTICDEAHLIPDIVCNIFNYEFTPTIINKASNLAYQLIFNFKLPEKFRDFDTRFKPIFQFFSKQILQLSDIIKYLNLLGDVKTWLEEISNMFWKNEMFISMFKDDVNDLIESIDAILVLETDITDLITKRPLDAFFDSEKIILKGGATYFKHILKDLSEDVMVRRNMIDKLNYGLFFSATLGNIDEYANLMGIKPDEYSKIYVPSTFDFSKSPIYLCNSGYLNYSNIENNLKSVLQKTIEICYQHPNEKGLIHTSTFNISNKLKEIIENDKTLKNRLLIYDSNSKEDYLNIFLKSDKPLILVGPSLYEGIDLPDDLCRFQILVKVPYTGLSNYVRTKMARYPFWYKRNCIEKIIQAIGRSNRHPKDYSTLYLLDSCFNDIVFSIPDSAITDRIEYKRI